MSKLIKIISLLSFFCLTPLPVLAGDFDGTKPLLGATIKIFECTEDRGCSEVALEDVGVPRFFIIDFKEKVIRPTKEIGIDKVSRIERMEHVDGKLILQGAEDGVEGVRDGVGWTIAISEETGKLILTASGEGVAFVAYGACTPQP